MVRGLSELCEIVAGQMHAPIRRHAAGVDCSGGRMQNVRTMLLVDPEIFGIRLQFTEPTEIFQHLVRNEDVDRLAPPLDRNKKRFPLAKFRRPTEHVGREGDDPHARPVIALTRQKPDAFVFQGAPDRSEAADNPAAAVRPVVLAGAPPLVLVIADGGEADAGRLGQLALRPIEQSAGRP